MSDICPFCGDGNTYGHPIFILMATAPAQKPKLRPHWARLGIADGVYARLVERLEKLIAEGPEFHGTDAQTEIVTAFGDLAGIWPAGVMDDALRAA